MNSEERIKLDELMRTNNTIDNTEKIRTLKHSAFILKDVLRMVRLKKSNIKDRSVFEKECYFLFINYTHIFNRILTDGIDLPVFIHFLNELKEIEQGKKSQQEASYTIGTLLKKMYIDPVINEDENGEAKMRKGKDISWLEYYKE